jgi:DNA-binding Lrp family transcriptional regulator
VEILHQQSGAIATRLMPSLKMYKIGVKFNLSGDGDSPAKQGADEAPAPVGPSPFRVTDADKRMIRVLQQDLPIESRPFDIWARQADTSVEALLSAAKSYETVGCMRRFSAVLRHRQAGFGANAMGAWIVPPDQRDAFGLAAARCPAVSHCYVRPTYPDWPYSMFTMVHGRSPAECEQVLSVLSAETGITQYAALYSSHEYNKVRVRYFTGDIETWESAALANA